MGDKIPVDLAVVCGYCGMLLSTSDHTQDSDPVRCNSCDRPIGTYVEIVKAAKEQAIQWANVELPDAPKPSPTHGKLKIVR